DRLGVAVEDLARAARVPVIGEDQPVRMGVVVVGRVANDVLPAQAGARGVVVVDRGGGTVLQRGRLATARAPRDAAACTAARARPPVPPAEPAFRPVPAGPCVPAVPAEPA